MMKNIKSLWALLPIAAVMLASCSSSEDATDPVNQEPREKKLVTIDIPITANASFGETTRAQVASDNVTLLFANRDSLWVTGKLSAASANPGDTDFPYELNGWLGIGPSGDAYQNPDFLGTLHYTSYQYSDLEHGKDWPGVGENQNPVYNYHDQVFKLHAVLKGLYQDKDSWPGEVTDVSQLTSLNFSGHPLCVANGESSALNEAVKKYSLLIAETDDNGIRISSELSRVQFFLEQKTVFLNFTVTFYDGTEAGDELNVTVANGGSTIGAGTVTAVASGDAVIANFVVPVAGGTVLNNATLSIVGYHPMPVGTNETLVAGTVYSINKAIEDAVQLWPGGPYFATRNVGAKRVTDPGQYFAWGETEGYQYNEAHPFWWNKECYWWDDGTPGYKWADGSQYKLLKYIDVVDKAHSYNGEYYDNLYELEPADDAATANWGSPWRMPTGEELAILCDDETHCPSDKRGLVSYHWTSDYNGTGVPGGVFTGTQPGYTDHEIFLPPAGYREMYDFIDFTEECYILSKTLCEYIYTGDNQLHHDSFWAWSAHAYSDKATLYSVGSSEEGGRQEGVPVRAVRNSPSRQ